MDMAQSCIAVYGKGPWEHGAHASTSKQGVGLAGGHWGLMPMRTDLKTLAEWFSQGIPNHESRLRIGL